MVTRNRLSPGIELHEIDRSQYSTKPDYSITGTTTAIFGWADKGEDYATQWINSLNTLVETYGYPTNEVEQYMFNAAVEVLGRGGICLMSKLPYVNKAKDSYVEVEYKLGDLVTDSSDNRIPQAMDVDPSLTSFSEISYQKSRLISTSTLDGYLTNSLTIDPDEIKIVDITRSQYGKMSVVPSDQGDKPVLPSAVKQTGKVERELIGIMPVIVSPLEAMFYQRLISTDTHYPSDSSSIEQTDFISSYTVITDAGNRHDNIFLSGELSASGYEPMFLSECDSSELEMQLSSTSIYDETLSKTVAAQFPSLNYIGVNRLEKTYLKQIGVVVVQTSVDKANEGKMKFDIVESYVGSLDPASKTETNHKSNYIANIINSQSSRIRFFSNIRTKKPSYKDASTFSSANQLGCIMGFAECECKKNITLVQSVIDPLNRILDKMKDPNQINLDIVCDAGVSNVAAYCHQYNSVGTDDRTNAEQYPFPPDGKPWTMDEPQSKSVKAWSTVLKVFDDFCKGTRRDCIYIADVIRPFCLEGNSKLVRSTKPTSTIENTILPKLKYLTALNSSWSAGYADWFYAPDAVSGEYFWCPPSIKAAGVYIYTDAYFHTWDAPAGMKRGVVNNVVDVAFSPMNDQAGKIYQQSWNYACNYPMEGIVIEGQKTFQLQPTALDRVNVRRLLISLEKKTIRMARQFLYEGNTEYLRQRFVDAIKPIFEDAKNGFGLNEYAIRCDDTLNTPDVIDRNELRCVIAVKPVKSIEYIVLSFITTTQTASVTEEVMR